MSGGRAWTASEDQFILANPRMSAVRVGKELGRTGSAIMNRRRKLRRWHGVDFGAERDRWEQVPWSVQSRILVARTCITCGVLHDGSWFSKDHRGWNQTCKDCISAKQRAMPFRTRDRTVEEQRRREKLDRSRAEATRVGETWTDAEMDFLLRNDRSTANQALALGRSYAAVQAMRRRLEVGNPHLLEARRPPEWRIFQVPTTRRDLTKT